MLKKVREMKAKAYAKAKAKAKANKLRLAKKQAKKVVQTHKYKLTSEKEQPVASPHFLTNANDLLQKVKRHSHHAHT